MSAEQAERLRLEVHRCTVAKQSARADFHFTAREPVHAAIFVAPRTTGGASEQGCRSNRGGLVVCPGPEKESRLAGAVFTVVVVARFLLPLLILRYPLPGVLACLVLDAADQTIFQAFTDDPLLGYQSYDKALDIFYLAVAYISTMRTWRDPIAFGVARFLYFYRLVGVVLFELLEKRWLIFVFANTFEYFFIAYEAIRTRYNPFRLSARFVVRLALFIWIFIKLPQEWWIHIAQNDFTDFMSDYPFMWGVLGALAAAAALAIYTQRRRIPTADWPFTVDIDRHLPASERSTMARERFWSMVLLEKVVLLTLISVIFANVLDVESSTLAITIGIAVRVVLNAAISQWLRSRGASWASTASQFGAMLLINLGIVSVEALLNTSGGRAPALNVAFFMVLLSLLIALFDRYRATREPGETLSMVRDALRAQRPKAG
jgi:hypothetical protein